MIDEEQDSLLEDQELDADPAEGSPDGSGRESDSHEDVEDEKDVSVLNKRLRDTQSAYHKKSEELKRIQSELDKVVGKVDLLATQATKKDEAPAEDPLSFLDDEELQTSLLDDGKNIAGALKKTVGALVGLLKSRDQYYDSRLKQGEAKSDPAYSKVLELRKDKDYEGFSDDQLMVIAKKLVVNSEAEEEEIPRDAYRGGAGRGSRVKTKPTSEFDKHVAYWDRKLGYDKI